jgi:NAD(P)-dependent dehydrogenase (short-subunit alcohol dehydrogenase family)
MRSISALRGGRPPVPSLEGRLCLITGAASGIGRATAIAAARAAARLVLTDVNAPALDALTGELGEAVVMTRALDVADFEAVRRFAEDTHAAHGSLDVVANVAGIATWGAGASLSTSRPPPACSAFPGMRPTARRSSACAGSRRCSDSTCAATGSA